MSGLRLSEIGLTELQLPCDIDKAILISVGMSTPYLMIASHPSKFRFGVSVTVNSKGHSFESYTPSSFAEVLKVPRVGKVCPFAISFS